jgi:uncharacterized protein YneF (UPF0154 family)
MKKQKEYFRLTLVISVLVGIILPLLISEKPFDWDRFFFIMAMGFTLIWFIYAVILFIITFLIVGRRNMKKRLKEGIIDKWGFS